jgi:hypothetical protein
MAMITGQSRRAMFEHEFGYELDGDTIVSPGKFEGEAWFAPIVYEWMLDGDGELVSAEYDESHDEFPSYWIFSVTDTDRREFGLDESIVWITLTESDQGFVYVKSWTSEEYLTETQA